MNDTEGYEYFQRMRFRLESLLEATGDTPISKSIEAELQGINDDHDRAMKEANRTCTYRIDGLYTILQAFNDESKTS